jgi:hypothetical protein
MSLKAVRRLALGGVIAALGAWLIIAHLVPSTGPRLAQAAAAADADTSSADAEPLAPLLAAATALRASEVPPSRTWPPSPFRLAELEPTQGGAENAPHDTGAMPTAFRLEGIISGPPPRALISGQILAVGDSLPGGHTVVVIDAYSVTLEGPQGTWTLLLPP